MYGTDHIWKGSNFVYLAENANFQGFDNFLVQRTRFEGWSIEEFIVDQGFHEI